MKKIIFCFLLLVQICFVYSQDEDWDLSKQMSGSETVKHGLIAAGEIFLSNNVLMIGNYIYGFSWAIPTLESIQYNFTTPWIWENDDGFVVNQIGHPYQGAMYFTAGRANGFGYYESLFFSMFGSFVWESLGESNYASINDFFTTSVGGMALGEMLYRLYVEAIALGVPRPVAFLINPLGGFHQFVTGWDVPNPGDNLYKLQYSIGAGYANTDYSLMEKSNNIFSYNGGFGDIGINIIYGNPFEQETNVPYRHFELAIGIGYVPGLYQNYTLFSDGYLFSFSPIYTEKDMMSTGLSMHFDFVSRGKQDLYDSTINQYSSAIDWTIKYQHLFSEDTSKQVVHHAGLTFLGVSNYYSQLESRELKNYGYGFNSKYKNNIENKKYGKFEREHNFYYLWTYPGTTALANGSVSWLFSNITYSRNVTEHISLGATSSLARERGRYEGNPNTYKRERAQRFFIAWNR